MGSLWMGDEVDLSGNKEKKFEGKFGGRGHSERCQKNGPVKKAKKNRGFFQESQIFDYCEDCGQEILDLPL